jgi:hypothetical protein
MSRYYIPVNYFYKKDAREMLDNILNIFILLNTYTTFVSEIKKFEPNFMNYVITRDSFKIGFVLYKLNPNLICFRKLITDFGLEYLSTQDMVEHLIQLP